MATKKWDDSPFDVSFKSDYASDWDIHQNYIQSFDAYEAMVLGQVYDSVSNSVDGSKITDSYATTLAKERADRVIAKLPDGNTEAVGKADVGKAMFMDILRQKWIYPNANAQYTFVEKLNMWQFYSSVYGYMPMFYDWNVSNTGYVGPDCWLWNPRNLVPQQGRVSIADMDYVTALTWVSKRYLDGLIAKDGADDGWDKDALKFLAERAATAMSDPDFQKDTKVHRDRVQTAVKKGICLATRYESGPDGEWVTFAPDFGGIEVRRLKNPHKNGRIPFVIKYSQPLFDSFYGLGDFQRAKPLQFARDGLTNFYFKGIKMNLIPPIVANANGVMKHTLDYREGGVMLETIPNSIRRLETSNAGLSTFQAAQSALTGSLLSLYGTQNASLPGAEALNPSQGKTPQAINMYSDKEATRDGAERRHLENAIEELTDGFFSMLVNIGTEDINLALFAEDIQDIAKQGYEDVLRAFKGKFKPNQDMTAAELKLNPKELKGVEYRFNIARDSTAKINKEAQRTAVVDAIGVIGKMQNVFQDDPRLTVRWDIIMNSYEGLSDVPGAKEWIEFDPNAQKQAPPPDPTVMDLPNGGKADITDIIKLYGETPDGNLRAQIAQLLGFNVLPEDQVEPTPEEPEADPVATSTGHLVRDPAIAAAIDNLNAANPSQDVPMPAEEQTPEPIVTPGGHVFNDPVVGAAANALHSSMPDADIPMPTEPTVK